MKQTTVAFLYNIRHVYPDPNDPRSQLEADFDDPETIDGICKHLRSAGFKVIPIEANEQAYLKLSEHKKEIDICLNYSEGIYGQDREAQLPAMLEMLQIPYTGSSPLTQALGLNKGKTKEILIANGIPTAPFQVVNNPTFKLDKNFEFPLIVKPLSQGSSAGITNKSVVQDEKHLKEQVEYVIKTFSQPALIEVFLQGRDFSVPMLGNPPEILPIIESDHSSLPKGYAPIDSLEVKWHLEEERDISELLVCPAKLDPQLKSKIKEISLCTWKALDILDWCRIDIRCNKNNNPLVLEFNSPAGLIPPEVSMSSYFPLSARAAGIAYEELLQKIIYTALERYNTSK